ncbi:MAG: Verru_Chthon cassette protein B [Verrucomicrobiales bacterium]|nr:Verru_Chthon cassette protein B [Verrucomicrobiales bacterium]MCP5558374.1 Verru_Chthon cassette protein B [Verrucomicrobiaceae bacterium]
MIPARPSTHHAQRLPSGFTLGEVLMAMLIISFAMLALIGMLPNALSTMSKSAQMSAESRIVQHLQAVYEGAFDAAQSQSDVSNITAKRTFNFDVRGTPIDGQSIQGKETFFVVDCQGTDSPVMPGESSASPFLRTISVIITSNYHDNSAPSTSNISGASGPMLNTHVRLLTFVLKRPLFTTAPSPETDESPSA